MRTRREIAERVLQYLRRPADEIRLAMLGTEESWHVVDRRFSMWINPSDLMDQMFVLGSYDPLVVQMIAKWIRAGDCCVDVGAHKGYVTHHLAYGVGPSGIVHSFEPDPNVRPILETNARHNGFGQVKVHPFALGREETRMRYFLSKQSGWSSMFPNQMAAAQIDREIEIQVKTFDGLVRDGTMQVIPDRFRFVKMDCEGAEPLVLQGMQETLERTSAVLWVEVNDGSLRAAGSDVDDIRRFLADRGYRLFLPRTRSLVQRQIVLRETRVLVRGCESYDAVAVRSERIPELRERGIRVEEL